MAPTATSTERHTERHTVRSQGLARRSAVTIAPGDAFGNAVERVLEMTNTGAKGLSAQARKELNEIFRTPTRYEWMFWT